MRLCYRAQWNEEVAFADHWVDFPKMSDVASGQFARVPRRLLQVLPFVFVDPSSRPFGFCARSEFRRLVEEAEGDDFASALEDLLTQVEAGTEAFSETGQVSAALDAVLQPVRRSLDLGTKAGCWYPSESISFKEPVASMALLIGESRFPALGLVQRSSHDWAGSAGATILGACALSRERPARSAGTQDPRVISPGALVS